MTMCRRRRQPTESLINAIEAKGRVVGDSAKYIAVAKKIMDEHNISIDDQYSFALKQLKKIQLPSSVHLSNDGSLALARQAVSAIQKALGN